MKVCQDCYHRFDSYEESEEMGTCPCCGGCSVISVSEDKEER